MACAAEMPSTRPVAALPILLLFTIQLRLIPFMSVRGVASLDTMPRVPSQIKHQDCKLSALEERITSEIAALKKALANYGDLQTEISKLMTRVDDLYTWKETADTRIRSTVDANNRPEKLLDGFPKWKTQVDTQLIAGQAKFEDFLSKHWRPHRKQIDQVLEDWQKAAGEKCTRVVAQILDDHNDEQDVYDPANDDKVMPMVERDGAHIPDLPNRSPKWAKGAQPWLKIQPLGAEDRQWTEQLMDVLLGERQDKYTTRLRDWLEIHSTDEMVASGDSIVECDNTQTGYKCLCTVLKNAHVHPQIFCKFF